MRRMMAFAKRMLGSLKAQKAQLALAVRLAIAAVATYAIAPSVAPDAAAMGGARNDGHAATWRSRAGTISR
jgi:hypothetical protein